MITIHQRHRRTDRETDRQTTCDRALHKSTSRGKNYLRKVTFLTENISQLRDLDADTDNPVPVFSSRKQECRYAYLCTNVWLRLSDWPVNTRRRSASANDGRSIAAVVKSFARWRSLQSIMKVSFDVISAGMLIYYALNKTMKYTLCVCNLAMS